jgi:hypothetical protein
LLCLWDRSYINYLVCVLHMQIVHCYALYISYMFLISCFQLSSCIPIYMFDISFHIFHCVCVCVCVRGCARACVCVYMSLLSLRCCVFNMLSKELLVQKDILRFVLWKMLVILWILGLSKVKVTHFFLGELFRLACVVLFCFVLYTCVKFCYGILCVSVFFDYVQNICPFVLLLLLC